MVTTRRQSLAASGSRPRREAGWVRQPAEQKPPFTVGQLRKAIPAHCWQRSAWRSGAYLALDVLLLAALVYASSFIDAAPVPTYVKWGLLWPLYWFFAGGVGTGCWVIGHECGHQAFSESQAINDGVGLVVHSLLLVPYYSWKHSHRRHHSNTGSLAKDEVFVPTIREEVSNGFEVAQLWPVRLAKLLFSFTLGWPAYLFFNVSGRPYDKSWVNHFDPWSPIFSKRERIEVAISDVALVAVLYGLRQLAGAMGWAWLLKTYIVPYMIVNFWLVFITLLQHTHPELPHYTDNEWDWLRGALATVDRDYGWLLNTMHHHIQDTHVCHHLFSTMPHYHAQEATEALKPILGEWYKRDDRPILKACWQDWSLCRYVAPDTPGAGILWFRK
ncbi:fatty acid delta-12 [Chlorella sorokiniana]|jgi:omega-6 fatty acid desaturase (delta-12 desaturase)|uniref:Fatty acid delta-12 n=1 Tax=Chlorella sorokiniana TaxID=3076 RepID=A0A2P6TU47_CHLSO|nr:fatty acid delta-12 [Chlorella sorokiniana]|eukprot:PRW57598.1 fatty acid delta-12 [Chlorella sorokiniana]